MKPRIVFGPSKEDDDTLGDDQLASEDGYLGDSEIKSHHKKTVESNSVTASSEAKHDANPTPSKRTCTQWDPSTPKPSESTPPRHNGHTFGGSLLSSFNFNWRQGLPTTARPNYDTHAVNGTNSTTPTSAINTQLTLRRPK